jgi:hypothetical protein
MIPFEIPANFATQLAAGELVRYGSILKSAATGQIVGHLQETGVVQGLLSSLAPSVSSPLSLASNLVNLAPNIYTAIQTGRIKAEISQIKTMMGTLQSMQVATLGLSLVGLGVSVGSFFYMRKRFNAVEARLDQIVDAINEGFDGLRKAALREQRSRTKGLIQRAEHAREHSNPKSLYEDVAAKLAEQAAYFEGEISFMVTAKGSIPADLFWQLTQSLMLCNNVRLDCGIRNNELQHTLRTSEEVATEYQGLFNSLTPTDFDGSIEDGLRTVRVLRDITDSAASKPYLIDYLRTRRIAGDEYLSKLEQEKENPLLMLKAS